jgi:hypothetical protein
MTHWRLQPVLDVTRLDEEKVRGLASVFDKYCREELRRLPEQFKPNDTDPIREGIDKDFLQVMEVKFSDKELNDLYSLVNQNLSTWTGESLIE